MGAGPYGKSILYIVGEANPSVLPPWSMFSIV